MSKTARLVRSALFVFLAATLAAAASGQDRASSPGSVDGPIQRTAPTQSQSPAKTVTGLPAAGKSVEQSEDQKSLVRAPVDVVRVLSSTTRGVSLELAADSFSTAVADAGITVSSPGFDRLAEPGEPDLPSRILLVAVPQAGEVRLSVSTEGTETSYGVRVRPAVGFDGRRQEAEYRIQGRSGFWPAAPAEILSIETLRGVRVARVRVSPAQYDASTSTLRLHRRVRVALSFDRPAVQKDRPDALDDVIKPMLANGDDAVGWKLDLPSQDTINFFDRSGVWCRVKTESTGVYRINAADLKAAGFAPESIAPATMRLYSIGAYAINGPYPDTMVEVPAYVKDNGDAKFDKGEYLAFYAESPSYWRESDTVWRTSDTFWRTNVFTEDNCWWLTWGGENGRRMATVSGAGATNPASTAYAHVRLEPDSLCPARSGLLWLWKDIVKIEGQDIAETFKLDLPQRDTIRWIKSRFYGKGSGYANARLYLNGSLVGDSLRIRESMSGPPPVDFRFDSLPVEAAARPGKPDSLTVELHGDPEMEVFLDFIEVGYAAKLKVTSAEPQLEFLDTKGGGAEFGIEGATGDVLLLDVTDPGEPRLVTETGVVGNRRTCRLSLPGLRRLRCALASGLLAPKEIVRRSPGNLRNPANGADYIIVCPDEFHHAAALLARYREGNVAGIPNARVRVVKLSEVYDDYAFGIEEPGATKHMLQAKRPAYVLLAGDGTYDYRNILQLRTGPVLPPYELGYDIDPEVYGGVAKGLDAWYADLDGGGSSPDLILGRVTVRSAVEMRAFLDRVKRYETQPPGYWAKRYLLLADDEIEGSFDREDGIRDHISPNAEEQARNVAGLLDPVKVYLTEFPLTGTNLKAEASTELIKQLNAGALLWCFFGHGAGFQLCHEQALHITNTVPSVNNGSRSPLAFYGSCGVGRFEDTRYEAIAEELVRRDGGTIAGVGATKATGSGGNAALARLMFRRLVDYPGEPIGPAFFQAYTQANTLYHLFGDPATVLRMPRRGAIPEVRPDTFYPGGRSEFEAFDTAGSKGYYEVSAREAVWHREYHSEYNPPPQGPGGSFSTSYDLPGYEIHHAAGTFDSSRILGSFIVPRMQYPETTDVANGRYIRLPGTGRVSLFSFDGSTALSFERDSIPLDTAMVETSDREPPDVKLYADGVRLVPGDTTLVPKSFDLVGRLSDSSGIFLVPNLDPAIQDVVLSLKFAGSRMPLAGYFRYDNNSTVRGEFTYPLEMKNAIDSVTIVASDNMVDPTNAGQNRTRVTVGLRTQLDDALKLDSCLVYPNPTDGAARFTFALSRAAMVSVKIFTIAGRLVRLLPPVACGFDYNQIEWDGLDKDGQSLANGVYLYKLDARATTGSSFGGSQSASFRDKFIVHR